MREEYNVSSVTGGRTTYNLMAAIAAYVAPAVAARNNSVAKASRNSFMAILSYHGLYVAVCVSRQRVL